MPESGKTAERTAATEPAREPDEATTESGVAESSPDLVVGDTALTESGNQITVHSFEDVPPTDVWQPEPGFEFVAADVEGCANVNAESAASLNPYDFQLQMPDNTRLDSDVGVREPPLNDTTLPPGECVRGYVTYQVPEGETPTDVIFTGSSIIEWAVEAVEEAEQAAPAEGTTVVGEQTSAQGQSPEDVLALQYDYVNAGDYEAAYELFADESQQLVSSGQYRAYFESNAPYQITSYSFPSQQVGGDTATLGVDLSVSSANGEEQYRVTQEMVLEDGGWRVVMRDEQAASFTGAASASPSASPDASPEPTSAAGAGAGAGSGGRSYDPQATASASASPASASPVGGDIDCDQVDGPIPTPPGDPYNLDGDGDGEVCE